MTIKSIRRLELELKLARLHLELARLKASKPLTAADEMHLTLVAGIRG